MPLISLAFLEFSRTAVSMSIAGAALLIIALAAAKNEIAQARGLDKIIALTNLCYAIPLAVFGAEHLSTAAFIQGMVPSYVPWHLFWAYFVGFALIAAALSIALKIGVQWSGLLFGVMMVLFVAMLHFPGALASHGNRIPWTIVFRELSFGGGAWILAGVAMNRSRPQGSLLIIVGRFLVAVAAIVFGVEHFLHPLGLPGVPLEKEMPAWVPLPRLIDYVTGALLLIAGVSMLANKKARTTAAYLGAWLVLLVVVIYGPVMILALADPGTAIKVEGLNYFADTLLFAGAILAVAKASPSSN